MTDHAPVIIFDLLSAMNLDLPLRTRLTTSMTTGKKTHAHRAPQTATVPLCSNTLLRPNRWLIPESMARSLLGRDQTKDIPHSVGTRLDQHPTRPSSRLGIAQFRFNRIEAPTVHRKHQEDTHPNRRGWNPRPLTVYPEAS